jgi:hypothetical protein
MVTIKKGGMEGENHCQKKNKYKKKRKKRLIGCCRSVAIVEKLAIHAWDELVEEEIEIHVVHRDITTHGENSKQKSRANARDKRRT